MYCRDMDKVILENVRIHGPGSKTFEDISKQYPGSTPAQVRQGYRGHLSQCSYCYRGFVLAFIQVYQLLTLKWMLLV